MAAGPIVTADDIPSGVVNVYGGVGGTPAASVVSEQSFGASPVVGVSTNFARQDHAHGTPADPVTAHLSAYNHANFVVASDARLSDARTPLTHEHAWSAITSGKPTTLAGYGITDAGDVAPNASYRTLLDSSGSHIAAKVAGTYGMAQGNPLAVTGTGTLYALNSIYIASADYPTVNGLAPKLRIRAVLACNDVAPTGNFTIGLHPITRPATSGAAGLCIYTIGAAVSGSTCVVNTPAADSLNSLVGSDFALPANGFYVIAVVTTATIATSAHVHISAALQFRNA